MGAVTDRPGMNELVELGAREIMRLNGIKWDAVSEEVHNQCREKATAVLKLRFVVEGCPGCNSRGAVWE